MVDLAESGSEFFFFSSHHHFGKENNGCTFNLSDQLVDERKELRAKIPSDALKFALEGVTRVLSK